MSMLFRPFARLRQGLSRKDNFRKDDRGIVTVQMVMFSVMIFGGVGLMMDFGRAYSAHSQMQGYIDQVALAAAQELDGKSDAISRATAAANAVSKTSAFIDGDGSFTLSSLQFMTDAPTDAQGDYSASLASTYNTQQPELAKYVRAVANSNSVTVSLLNFASDAGGGITDIDISASAVATVRKVTCGGLSPMVMCNPYETASDTSWQQEIANGIGYRMKLTANDRTYAKPSNYESGVWQQIRLGLLKRPDLLMNVRNTVCTDLSRLPDDGTTTEDMRRDICMLATVEAGLSCINDEVAFRGAHPTAVTTGLGVPFDMYDGPMQEVLDTTWDISFTHSFPSSLGFASTINPSSLFYPDSVVGHGRMPRSDFDIYLDNEEYRINNATYTHPNPNATPQQQAGYAFFARNGELTNLANLRAAYGTPSSNPPFFASRVNHPFATGQRTEWGPAPVRTCLEVENCDTQANSTHPTIYQAVPGTNEIENFAAALYAPYLMQEISNANPSTYPNWWELASLVDAGPLVNNETTYYGFYANVERTTAALRAESATDGHDGNDGTGAWINVDYQGDTNGDGNDAFDADDIHYGTEGTQVGSRNFQSVMSTFPTAPEERRVQRVTVVNCEAAQAYATATGSSASGFSDTYVGEVVDVVDLFMITPPQVTGCDPVVSNDPDGNYLCENEDVSEVHLDVELVDAASINSVNFDARFYAVLVH